MPDSNEVLQRMLVQQVGDVDSNPAPPPPMPTAVPRMRPSAQAADVKPAVEPVTGGWEVDPDEIDKFSRVVERTRWRLQRVQAEIDRMRSSNYTPHLGISPVGQQLEKKFNDRLDAPLDDPQNPTTGGLRPMLAEAMRRMDEFIAGAEAAAKEYREMDESGGQRMSSTGQND